MRSSVVAGLGAAALAAGVVAAVALRADPAEAIPGDVAVAPPRRDHVKTLMIVIELGHRRAFEYLRRDSSQASLVEAANRASLSVVRVVTRRVRGGVTTSSRGSGVVVGERRVLTAGHLVAEDTEEGEILVLLPNGTEIPAKIVARGERDRGLLPRSGDWLALEVMSAAPQLPPPLRMASATAAEKVVVIGFGGDAGLGVDGHAAENETGPSGLPTWSVGRVVDPQAMSLEPLAGNLPVNGASGGPVVDSKGAVVGVLCGLSSSTSTAFGMPPMHAYTVYVAPAGRAAAMLDESRR